MGPVATGGASEGACDQAWSLGTIHSLPIDVRRDRVTMNATPSATSEGRRQCGVLVAPAAGLDATSRSAQAP